MNNDTGHIIFLDMDGVLADFNTSTCKLFGTTYEELIKTWSVNEWDMATPMGLSNKEFYKKLRSAGEEFWFTLEPYPWALDLWKLCKSYGETYILTYPTHDPGCISGKIKWMKKYLNKDKWMNRFFIGEHKYMLAQEDRILIDDHNENVIDFGIHGGNGVIFPRRWNRLHELAGDPVAHVRSELDRLTKGTE